MKTKHRRTLNNYLTYGETFSTNINYEEKYLKLVNYGKLQTTRPTERLSKANLHGINKNLINNTATEAKIALCGASIVNGLQRYPDVWNNFFAPLSAINLGIGGD